MPYGIFLPGQNDRHPHEIVTGRTSSVGLEILGFDAKGSEVIPTNHALTERGSNMESSAPGLRKQQMAWEEVSKQSSKIVSFIDLAGHEKLVYFHLITTLI